MARRAHLASRGACLGVTAIPPPYRTEWRLLGLALLLLGTALGYSLVVSYRYIDQTERERLQGQASVIEDNLGRQIEAVDQALGTIQAALALADAGGTGSTRSRLLADLTRALPGVRTLAQFGPDGRVIAASQDGLLGASLAKEPRFRHAQAQPDTTVLQIAEPYLDARGVWTVALLRSLAGPAGEFAGIVEATLEPAYFNVLLGSVLYAPDMRAVLMHGNGRLFLNMPANQQTLGAQVDQPGSFFRRHRDGGASASLLRGPTLTGADSLVALRSLHRPDLQMDGLLVLALVRDAAVVYGPWRTGALLYGGSYTLLALAAGLALYGLQRRRRLHDRRAATDAAELAASEARFRSLARLSSDWYWEQDANLRFVRLVGDFEHPMRTAMGAFLGQTRWDTPALNLTDAGWARHRAVLESRQEFRDLVIARPDAEGRPRWVSVSGEPIFDTGGAFCGYRGTGRDISAQMQADEALRLSEERLQLMLRGSHDAPWDLDLKTDQLWLAQRWSAVLGWDSGTQRLTPALWQERCHPDDAVAAAEVFRDAITGGADDYEIEMRLRHRDGHFVPMLMRGFILRDARGRAIRASGVNTDLTERRRADADRDQLARAHAEQQLREVELAAAEQARHQAEQHAQRLGTLLAERERTLGERDQLLGLLAHEVRQPLNNASAALEGAAMAMGGPQFSFGAARDRLERAHHVLDQVVSTVNNALSASILLTSAERVTTQEAEIDTVIALALADLGAQGRARVQAERVTRGRTAELNIALMRLALRNLLANALAYSPDNTVVELSVDIADDPLALVIEVRDAGDGISADLLPRLFERGTRGPCAADVPGAGLGLYVVAQVAALHQGSVEVLPNQPRGTVFRMVLPQGRVH
jgi:PAS domain S-box-containing protein